MTTKYLIQKGLFSAELILRNKGGEIRNKVESRADSEIFQREVFPLRLVFKKRVWVFPSYFWFSRGGGGPISKCIIFTLFWQKNLMKGWFRPLEPTFKSANGKEFYVLMQCVRVLKPE
jgi:hypothetical protein